MTTSMPTEWFKTGKAHQFEGRHLEAVDYFEKCLAADWRTELTVKELYNSLVKLTNYSRASDILHHYGHKISQKDWLKKEQLNLNKKLQKTEVVRAVYLQLLEDQAEPIDMHGLLLICNELALYYYRLGLNSDFDSLCSYMEKHDNLNNYISLLRSKWLLHLLKDVNQFFRTIGKHSSCSEVDMANTLVSFKDEGHLNRMIQEGAADHVFKLAVAITEMTRSDIPSNLGDDTSEKLIYEAVIKDSTAIFDRLLKLKCVHWSLSYIIAIGKSLIKEGTIRTSLQELAAELILSRDIQFLEALTSGIPELYVVESNREENQSLLFDQNMNRLTEEYVQLSSVDIPSWSKSEQDYLDAFTEALSKSIDKGLRFLKQAIIVDVRAFEMTVEETLDALWRLRMHYSGRNLEKNLNWLKQVLDMIVKDVNNEGLWLELPHVVLSIIKCPGLGDVKAKQLAKVGSNAYLYALYCLEKRSKSYPVPERENIEDEFETLYVSNYWHNYVLFIETCQYYGHDLSNWDALYAYFQGAKTDTYHQEEWLDRIFNRLLELAQDLNQLTTISESARYLPYSSDSLKNALTKEDSSLGYSIGWLLNCYLDLSKGNYKDYAYQLVLLTKNVYPIEELNSYLILISIMRYEDKEPCINHLCESVEKLLTKTHDHGLFAVYQFLKNKSFSEVGQLGYKLINHALIQMQKAQPLNAQFVSEVRIDYLERVELENGLAVFELMSTLDPTNLTLSFHTIDLKICLQQYEDAGRAIDDWIKYYESLYLVSPEDKSHYETIQYQNYWLQATDEKRGPLLPLDALSRAIYDVKDEMSNSEIDFFRDVLIHRDIEIVYELLKIHGHRAYLHSSCVLNLMHLIFGVDFRALMLMIWHHKQDSPLIRAYSNVLIEQDSALAIHFEAVKNQYHRDYGAFNQWVSFSHGKVVIQQESWSNSLDGSIQYGQNERFLWLTHLGGYLMGVDFVVERIAEKLEFYRFAKWSSDSWWIRAYEILPFGKLAVEMGREALRQGRYETARQCYNTISIGEIIQVMSDLQHPVVRNGHMTEKKLVLLNVIDSAISYLLAPSGIAEFHERTFKALGIDKSMWLYLAVFARAEAKEFGKSLKEALKVAVHKTDVEPLILTLYAHEQRLAGNNQLAARLEELYRQM